jgi:hypothetical protein
MIVSFNLDEFNLPLTDQTITVRPKKEISESTPVVTDYKVVFNAADAKDVYNVKSITVGSLDSAANSNFLFQAEFEIDRTSNIGDRFKSYFTPSGHTVTPVDSELTAAAQGTYTDINGNSITVTGPVEINNNKTKATINILANVSTVPSKLLGSVNISLGIEQYAWGDITLISGDCSVSDSAPSRTAWIHNSLGGYGYIGMGSALTEDLTGNNIFNNTGKTINTYKVKGVAELITTETKNGIERVIDIAKCFYDSDNDGIDDLIDTDDDNDGVLDINDDFPLDPTKSGDNDGDGVDASVDIDDNDPAVGSSTLNTDFFIALDLYGKSGNFELKDNNEVRTVGENGGVIDVNVELIKSAIGWGEDLEYRAYVVDNGDGTNWVTLTGSIGTPVEVDNDDKIIRGDLLQVTVQPTSDGSRDLNLQVDLYHKPTNTKVAATTQRVSQISQTLESFTSTSGLSGIPSPGTGAKATGVSYHFRNQSRAAGYFNYAPSSLLLSSETSPSNPYWASFNFTSSWNGVNTSAGLSGTATAIINTFRPTQIANTTDPNDFFSNWGVGVINTNGQWLLRPEDPPAYGGGIPSVNFTPSSNGVVPISGDWYCYRSSYFDIDDGIAPSQANLLRDAGAMVFRDYYNSFFNAAVNINFVSSSGASYYTGDPLINDVNSIPAFDVVGSSCPVVGIVWGTGNSNDFTVESVTWVGGYPTQSAFGWRSPDNDTRDAILNSYSTFDVYRQYPGNIVL